MSRPGQITQLRIAGLRVIEDITLDLNGLTVLIGDNGTGKSSILEALELLRMASKRVIYALDILEKKHSGLQSLLRRGSSELRLGCRVDNLIIENETFLVDYDMTLAVVSGRPTVVSEEIKRHRQSHPPSTVTILTRTTATSLEDSAQATTEQAGTSESRLPLRYISGHSAGSILGISLGELALTRLEASQIPEIQHLTQALENIDVHVPFETRPFWQQKDLDLHTGPRMPCLVEPTKALSRYGVNLANAFQELRNQGAATWERVIARAQLGIRHDVRDFRISPYGRGQVELQIVFGDEPNSPMPVEYLSEGQLTYLAMIALCELSAGSSVLAFDEPEIHLHPGLLARVMFMMEKLSTSTPVILSTHSDRLLDCLSDPAASVVLCDLGEDGTTRLRRPDKEALASWLENYSGVGRVATEGYIEYLFHSPLDKGQAS